MVCSGIIIIIIIPLMAIGQLCAGHYWCKTPSYLLTGHYCHFSLLCSVNRKKKKRQKKKKEKSFGIYWEWDETFDLKVPRVGDRTASGGSSFQSLTVPGKKVWLL